MTKEPAIDSIAQQIVSRERAVLAPVPELHEHVAWDSASGARVRDVDGREYIDFTSGVLVANIGHCHPSVAKAIAAQASKLINAYDAPHALRAPLAERLLAAAGGLFDKAAFLTTGAEALDACLRIARAYTGRTGVLSFGDAFHGKSLSTAAIGGIPSQRRHLGPTWPGLLISPYPNPYRPPAGVRASSLAADCVALADELLTVNSADGLAAIIVEPYLGQGGAIVPPPDFLPLLRTLADKHGALLVIDEIQSGLGRVGSMFAFQQLKVKPDLLALAKGLASGVPMSAVLGRGEFFAALPPGRLWSTFGGNPLSCAAALATLDVLETPGFIERVEPLGDRIAAAIRSWEDPGVGEVRSMGFSFGVEMVRNRETKEPDPERASAIVLACERHGLIILPPAGRSENVLRLAPPLVITDEEVQQGLVALRAAMDDTR